MMNIKTKPNPEFDNPAVAHPELNADELTTVVAVRRELSSIVNPLGPPTIAAENTRSPRASSWRRWGIIVSTVTALIVGVTTIAVNPNGSTALAAQYVGLTIPDQEPHFAPTSLPQGYSVSNLVRPEMFRNPVAQTLVLGREDNGAIRDYTTIDLLGPWAPAEATKAPDGAVVTEINGHRSWEVPNDDPNWLWHQVALDCGTAIIFLEAGQREAAIRRLGALRCNNNSLNINRVDNLTLLYDGPPYAGQNDAFLFTLSTPSNSFAMASIGWSIALPEELAKRLSSFVPAKPPSNKITVNGATGHLLWDSNASLFRLEFSAAPEPGKASAHIQVAGKSKDEVLAIAQSIQAVSESRWQTITKQAGIKP
jgi:hypothetical protein